jgi:photosystem II stability/assembly factor-like uncharacterized protein
MVNVPEVGGRVQTIADLDVNTLTMDPEDSSALYLASVGSGLYYTYNIQNGWSHVDSLPSATINDVKVDPQNKCVIYAAIQNRLYRSADCTRTWTQVYFDNNAGVSVTTIAIDYAHSQNIYIGTSRGDIIKSIDSGSSWRTIHNLTNSIGRLIISPLNSSLLFVATTQNQVYSFTSNTTTNAGNSSNIDQNFAVDNWTDMNAALQSYSLGSNFKNIVVSAQDGTVYLATDKMILRSPDNGITWENIKLIPPAKDAAINAIAVNPQNSNDLYYVTNTVFFRSADGGVTWTTQSLPSGRGGHVLLIDFKNPNNLYLGTIKLKS